MTKEDIAEVTHEVNRAYCESLDDNSQPPWKDAEDWQRKSAILGVEVHLKNPNLTPEESHECWLKEKKEAGWVYGIVKDVEMKTHPCCIPYGQLPFGQRTKDFLFKQVVNSLAKFVEKT